ncbi:CHC2 zinc finger domain-containing protein [uncultured Parabacteroides sp.]|uniref:DNA primase n=1 Tax=uncultured Parabacteroides sp. TaxID=512312 RepID=UPI0025835C74|nr:CHC2 zinc finger domain-containing protein [uncultured Parabacteroides sp.]
MNLKEQILAVIRLEDVIERYLPLRKNGGSANTLTGLCPFHDDRHPSFCVNVKKQYYKCFVCGEGGDVFKFVQKMEGCDFHQVLKILAGWYGLSGEDDYLSAKPLPVKNKSRSVSTDVVSQAARDHLLRNHQMMQGLLKEYVPENDQLQSTYQVFEVGIAPSSLPYDYHSFANRLIFPVRNERGKLVAFAGRYRGETKGTDIRKYVNSPDSPVYHKGEILYGLYQAQEAIRQHGFVYITEGYKDVLAMHAAGFRNTVALCGTALTEQQMVLLSRYTWYAIVMLDGDEAGQTNAIKSARLLSGKGFSVGRIVLEPKHDPDSLLCQMGREAFIDYMKAATRFSRLEVYEATLLRRIKQILSQLRMALTVEERRELFVRMIPLHKRLAKVTELLAHSPILKADWLLDY